MKNLLLIISQIWHKYWYIFCYALILIFLTLPLIIELNSGFLGMPDGDAPMFYWDAWQLNYNISNQLPLFEANNILFPNNFPLILHTYNFIHSGLTVFLNTILPLTLSFNLVFLLTTLIGAYSAFKFFELVIKSRQAAFLGGLIFTFQPIWSIYTSIGTQNLLSLWFIPATLAAYEYGVQKEKKIWMVIAGLIMGLSAINDYYIFAFTALALSSWILCSLIIRPKQSLKYFFATHVWLIAGIIPPAIFLGLELMKFSSFIFNTEIPSVSDVDLYHADLINLFRPSEFHPILGRFSDIYRNISLRQGNSFIGLEGLVLFLIVIFNKTIRQRVNKRLLLSFTLAYLIIWSFACGPYLHVWGYNTQIPMPYLLISKFLPQILNLRMAMRWLMPAQFFFAGIIALLFEASTRSLNIKFRYVILCLTVLLFTFEVSFFPRQIISTSHNNYLLLEELKNEPLGSVLELPLGINSGYWYLGSTSKLSMLHQTIHEHPMINGHLSRLSHTVETNYKNEPVISYILNYDTRNPDQQDLNPATISEQLKKYDLKYIIIDKQNFDLSTNSANTLKKYLENQLGFNLWKESQSFEIFGRM